MSPHVSVTSSGQGLGSSDELVDGDGIGLRPDQQA